MPLSVCDDATALAAVTASAAASCNVDIKYFVSIHSFILESERRRRHTQQWEIREALRDTAGR